eukprot:TRINITY_DN2878_c0_g2_i7.p1 TRINITY_DN2878_c0_g2~~TRINITY_DN2878_c0_g2_i7.p1  ORF type:complete len:495 (-),score=132.81 TRINITY_DN2878_c0_g2_i7:262-1746(-)
MRHSLRAVSVLLFAFALLSASTHGLRLSAWDDNTAPSNFGFSFAVAGPHFFVGAIKADSDSNVSPRSGAVYVFHSTSLSATEISLESSFGANWVQMQKITAPDAHSDMRFGCSLALDVDDDRDDDDDDDDDDDSDDDDDGDDDGLLVVGADLENRQGAVYVFTLESTGKSAESKWTFHQKLTSPSRTNGTHFGAKVATDDDDVIIVSEPGFEQGGAVFVFTRMGGSHDYAFSQRLSGQMGSNFGSSSVLYKDWWLIGASRTNYPSSGNSGVSVVEAGAVLVYSARNLKDGVSANPLQTIFSLAPGPADAFGMSISAADHVAAIGSPYADVSGVMNSGKVELFTITDAGVWVHSLTLQAATPTYLHYFGWKVQVSESALVVATPSSPIYVYDVSRSVNTVQVAAKYQADGSDGSISDDGAFAIRSVVSENQYEGAVYVEPLKTPSDGKGSDDLTSSQIALIACLSGTGAAAGMFVGYKYYQHKQGNQPLFPPLLN